MRKINQPISKSTFRDWLVHSRETAAIAQSDMTQLLWMNNRSYAELEHGKSCCIALTLVIFLQFCCPDSTRFLEELRHAFATGPNKVA